MKELLTNFVEKTIKLMVDDKEEIQVKILISTKSVIIHIYCNRKDIGKIIGKKGRTIESLKTIALAIKNTEYPDDIRKLSLEIQEDPDSGFSYDKSNGG